MMNAYYWNKNNRYESIKCGFLSSTEKYVADVTKILQQYAYVYVEKIVLASKYADDLLMMVKHCQIESS